MTAAPRTSAVADTRPASPEQISYLRDLAGRMAIFGRDLSPDDTVARLEETIAGGLTVPQASALIDAARGCYPHPRDQVPANDATLRRLRWRAEDKAVFGIEVPRADTITRMDALIEAGLTQQAADDLLRGMWDAKPYPSEKSPLPLSLVEGIDGLTISEGHYAVMYDGALRFYRIYTVTTGALRGQVVMKRFASSNLIALYPGEAKTVLTEIDAAPDVAAYRFADEFTLCWVCAKQLTDAVSRLLAVGPVCRGFHEHSGLRDAATAVDTDKSRRLVFRALRQWALDQGYVDPRSKEQRKEMNGTMTASRLASAWSGLPGVLTMGTPEEVVAAIEQAIEGDLTEQMTAALLAAPVDTLGILIDSGVLTGPVMQVLMGHGEAKIREAAGDFFVSILAG